MSFVTYEPQGAVAYLIINRPEALNALNSQVLADLEKAGEPEAWAWASEAQAKAHSLVDPIIGK